MFERRKINIPWEGIITPHKIIGNVYFAGTFQASCHLVDTGDGLILIDTGYENTLYLLIDSIYKLGFKPTDIKYIINTHWHSDHTGATSALAQLSGAKTHIGRKDAKKAEKYFKADILIDGCDTLALGNTLIRFIETPGHTEGTISLFFDIEENGVQYHVGTFGGAGANTLIKGAFDYANCREDYLDSINRLRKENVDVFIGNHVWNNNTEEKLKKLKETGVNEFVDKTIWIKFLDYCENRLKKIIENENAQE